MILRVINNGELKLKYLIPGKLGPVNGIYYWANKDNPILFTGTITEKPFIMGANQTGNKESLIKPNELNKNDVYTQVNKGTKDSNVTYIINNGIVFRFLFKKYSMIKSVNEMYFVRQAFLTAMESTITTINPNVKVDNIGYGLTIDGNFVCGYLVNTTSHAALINISFDNTLSAKLNTNDQNNQCFINAKPMGLNNVLPNVTIDAILNMFPIFFSNNLGIPMELSSRTKEEQEKYMYIVHNGIDMDEKPLSFEDDLRHYSEEELKKI